MERGAQEAKRFLNVVSIIWRGAERPYTSASSSTVLITEYEYELRITNENGNGNGNGNDKRRI